MTPIRLLAGCVAAAVAFIAAAVAMAQSPPTRLRGSIAAIDGKTATIATREGTQVPVNARRQLGRHAGQSRSPWPTSRRTASSASPR